MEMDPPPPPPPLSTAPPISTAAQPPPNPSNPNSTKLRLMCSYGGHIIPRPHDKTLCYIGGDTRIIVVDRKTTLADLYNLLSTKTIFNGKPFTLKYQLPNEDLDSLISITTDEDLENMIDEYDRIVSGSVTDAKASRIRLFCFPVLMEPSYVELLLENTTRSENWFLDALNGNIRESLTSVNCLLGLDDVVQKQDDGGSARNGDGSTRNGDGNGGNGNNGVGNGQDVHSVPGSPLDRTSSFGSGTSLPALRNLPPIKVHVEESGQGEKGRGGLGIEEKFQEMSVGGGAGVSPLAPVVTGVPAVVGSGENGNRVFSDDEKSEQGVAVGYRKVVQEQPQVQLQHPIQLQQKPVGAVELPSPSSVSSEGSMTSRQRQMVYQEQIMQTQPGNTRALANPVDPNNRVQMPPQVQETEYVMPGQFDKHPQLHQQQFGHGSVQYIHPHAAPTMPIPSYYPVYPPQQQRHPHHAPALEQQYVYYVPARPAQAYNVPVQQQTSYTESPTTTPTSRTQTPPPVTMVNPTPTYNPALSVPVSNPEMAAGAYRTSASGSQQSAQVHSSQHQRQYVGYSHMHHPAKSVAPYEYADPMHAQVYYTQRLTPQLAAQYQTMTSAAAMVLPGASPQVPSENIKPQNSISQP